LGGGLLDKKRKPKFKHHYLIGVVITDMTSSEPGRFQLKYRPVYYTNNDIELVAKAIKLSKDQLFKTTKEEAMKVQGCQNLVVTISTMMHSIRANNATLHHFTTEEKVDEEWFETLVESANFSESSRRILLESRISR
jgi:hypothetical protein